MRDWSLGSRRSRRGCIRRGKLGSDDSDSATIGLGALQLLNALAGTERHIASAERLSPRSRGHLQHALLERGELPAPREKILAPLQQLVAGRGRRLLEPLAFAELC